MDQIPPGVDLSQIPVGKAPPGYTSNFAHPSETLGPAIIGVSTTMYIITTFIVAARLYANTHSQRRLGLDDYSCIVAMIMSYGVKGIVISETHFARHVWDIPLSDLLDESFQKKEFAGAVILGPALFCAKLSLLLLYRRVFGVKNWLKWCIYFGIIFIFFVYWTWVVIEAVYCTPPPGKSWTVQNIGAKCLPTIVGGVVQGALNMVVDVSIFVLPIPTVLSLKLPPSKKFGLLLVFMTGLLALVASALAAYFRIRLWETGAYGGDSTWLSYSIWICIICEIDTSIICASLPALASLTKTALGSSKFISSIRSRFLTRGSGSKSGSSANGPPFLSSSTMQSRKVHLSDSNTQLRDNTYIQLNDTSQGRWKQDSDTQSGTELGATKTTDLEMGHLHEVRVYDGFDSLK